MRTKILCIEDDLTTQTIIKYALKEYNIVVAQNIQQAEVEIAKGGFAAALFDIELPDGDGLHFYSRIKKDSHLDNVPILFLTGHADISNKLLAFSVGADDFISKPFDPLELNARVLSKINKSTTLIKERNIRKFENIELDMDRQKVFKIENGNEIDLNLTAIEQKIFILLSSRPEQVFSREQILNSVWSNAHITDRTVDSHIAHLRNKLYGTRVMINTVKNFGYKIVVNNNNTHVKKHDELGLT